MGKGEITPVAHNALAVYSHWRVSLFSIGFVLYLCILIVRKPMGQSGGGSLVPTL
jgi:hypothetical protein